MYRVSSRLSWMNIPVLGLCLAACLLMGCEEDVAGPDPFQFPYSMWGVLNPLADTQFVRVFPIETSLSPGLPQPLDASFISEDLSTGATLAWRDSVVVDTTGVVGHIFYRPFQPEWGRQYRLAITDANGATSQVEVDVPEQATLVLHEPDTTRNVMLSATVQGEIQQLIQSEVEIYVSYVVGFSPPPIAVPIFDFYRHVVPYDEFLRRAGNDWTINIDLERNYQRIFSDVSRKENFIASQGIRLLLVEFRVIVANTSWMPPEEGFDPNILVQPGVMENVENGFGFVGGGYRLGRPWTLPFEVVEKTSFIPNR